MKLFYGNSWLFCFFFWFVEILCFPVSMTLKNSLHHFSSGPSHNIQNHNSDNSLENGRGKQIPHLLHPEFSAEGMLRGNKKIPLEAWGNFSLKRQSTNFNGETYGAFSTFELYNSCHLNIWTSCLARFTRSVFRQVTLMLPQQWCHGYLREMATLLHPESEFLRKHLFQTIMSNIHLKFL